MLSVVYLLTNPAMPGLVKIGRTGDDGAVARLAQLYTTGVPFPFEVEFVCRVPNSDAVEKALHTAFAPQRVNPKREFFEIDAAQAIAILKLLHVPDDTEEFRVKDPSVEQAEVNAGTEYRQRGPNLNFEEMGIPIGSELTCSVNGETVYIHDPKRVAHRGAVTSLTAATRLILDIRYSVAPGPYWTFNGRSISEIYDETYPHQL